MHIQFSKGSIAQNSGDSTYIVLLWDLHASLNFNSTGLFAQKWLFFPIEYGDSHL
jgi:hypothetical protein